MAQAHVVILGGGPAGVGAAYQLRKLGRARVTLLERESTFGGNAGSFFANGQFLDYGSHRFHPSCDPVILQDVRDLLKGDLLTRARNGRIRLKGKWIRFPLKPIDLLLRLDKSFALGVARDMVPGRGSREEPPNGTFASVLRRSLGTTICEHFYFPYARKIWGREPEELSGIQARKRVSAGTFSKLIKRLASPPGAGNFYYPRRGYGQISQAFGDAARDAGAEMRLGWSASKLERPRTEGQPWLVGASGPGGERREITADYVWSTIPVTAAARIVSPGVSGEVAEAASRIQYRAIVLVFIELGVDRFSATDAHYFPEAHVAMTRLSEPKNYSGVDAPRGRTTLCAEIPCTVGDEVWSMDDPSLGRLVAENMESAGLALPGPPLSAFSRKLSHAYPIYLTGYEAALERVEDWVAGLPRFLTYGRQGLFAHDNAHHALSMAYAAVDCLGDSGFDGKKWSSYREVFSTHVVED